MPGHLSGIVCPRASNINCAASKISLVQMTPRRLHILIKYTVTLNDRFNLKVTLPLPRVLTVTFKVLALFGHLLGIKFSLGPFAPSLKFDKSQKSTKERMIIARNLFNCSLMTFCNCNH